MHTEGIVKSSMRLLPTLSMARNASPVKMKLVAATRQLAVAEFAKPSILKIVAAKYMTALKPTNCWAAWSPQAIKRALRLDGEPSNSFMEVRKLPQKPVVNGCSEFKADNSSMLPSMSSPDECVYTCLRTRSASANRPALMRYLGVSGRSKIVMSWTPQGRSESKMVYLQPESTRWKNAPAPYATSWPAVIAKQLTVTSLPLYLRGESSEM